MHLSNVVQWITAHPDVWWPVLTAVLLPLVKRHSADEWLALGQENPRAQGFIKILTAAGFDTRKAYEGLVQVLTAKSPPVPRVSVTPTPVNAPSDGAP